VADQEARRAWLQGRKSSVGASDVAGVLGLGDPRWSTPLAVWQSKISEDVDMATSGPAAMGLDLEPFILRELGKRLGAEVYSAEAEPIRHPTVPLAVNPDAMVADPETGEWCPCEVKFATGDQLTSYQYDPALEWNMLQAWLSDPQGGAPFPAGTRVGGYYCQIQAQILCTGASYGWLVGVIGARAGYLLRIGQELPHSTWRQLRIEADEQLHSTIEAAVAAFWSQYVEPREPPPLLGKGDLRALKAAYRQHADGRTIELPDGEAFAQALDQARKEAKAQKATGEDAEAWLRRAMGDAEAADCGPYRVTSKTNKRGVRPIRIRHTGGAE